MFRKARVKMNLKAQLPEEIDLVKDEIVIVIEETEKGWYRGECNGKQGIFPASFVTLLNEDPLDNLQSLLSVPSTNSYNNDLLQNGNHSGYDCINSGITPYGRTIYPFQAEFPNELSFGAGEIVNLIRHVGRDWIEGELNRKIGIFPANFINIIVDCPDSKEKSGGTSETSDEGDNLFPADTYGRVICDFTPEVEGGVQLKEGDTVTLIRKVSQNWFEFITDNGETGLCPDCYIEVIGSGPPSYAEVMGSDSTQRFSLVSTGNIALENINTSSQQENPASFSSTALSSFSSHRTGSNDIFSKDVSSQSIDDKISDSLKGLDSSLFESTDNSFNSHGFKTFSSDSFTGSKKLTNFNNWLSDPQSENRSQNIHQTNISDWSSDLFSSSVTNDVNDIANKKNQHNVPSIVNTPARPPPPSIVSQSPNTSLLNNSSASANSTRLSVTSVSSQSSSDTDCFDQSDIKSILQQKEKALEIRLACKKKLENENLQNSNNFVSEEVKTQLTQLNEDIKQLKEEIEMLQSELKVQENTGGSTAHECRQRDEEVARKKAEEEKRR
ncbi:Dynamin-binding protein, partial [Stegodyphus mimosarum]